MFVISKSYKDEFQCVKSLEIKLTNIIDNNKELSLKEDPCIHSFFKMRELVRSVLLNLNLLHSWYIGDESMVNTIQDIIGVAPHNQAGLDNTAKTLQFFCKSSLNLLIQFQIENLISLFLDKLNIEVPGGFYQKIIRLESELSLKKGELANPLMVPAHLRNSLHSDGRYKGYKGEGFSYLIEEVPFNFIDGEKVDCASIPHIAHSLENSIRIIKEKVLSHKDLIADQEGDT